MINTQALYVQDGRDYLGTQTCTYTVYGSHATMTGD